VDTPKKVIEYLRTISTDYVDQRVVTELELRALAWFLLYGENVTSQCGGTWRGASFRQRGTTCLLTWKVAWDGIPQVVFVTAQNPVSCVVSLCKKWHAGTLRWVEDKYP